jgi:hypothetical protein
MGSGPSMIWLTPGVVDDQNRCVLRYATLAASAALLLAAGPAHGMGVHGFRATPDRPVAGAPITLTVDLTGTAVTGQSSFSWDLDGDSACETAWTTDTTVVVTKPVGTYMIKSCARDDIGEMDCSSQLTVWPAGPDPAVTYDLGSVTWDEFLAGGATVQATWNRPVTATYTAQLGNLPLTVRTTSGDRFIIDRPPPTDGRRHMLKITADLRQDPTFGPVASALGLRAPAISIPAHHPIGPLAIRAPTRVHAAKVWHRGLSFAVTGLARKGGASVTLSSRRGRFLQGWGRADVDGTATVVLKRSRRAPGPPAPGTYRLHLKLHTATQGWIRQTRTIVLT